MDLTLSIKVFEFEFSFPLTAVTGNGNHSAVHRHCSYWAAVFTMPDITRLATVITG